MKQIIFDDERKCEVMRRKFKSENINWNNLLRICAYLLSMSKNWNSFGSFSKLFYLCSGNEEEMVFISLILKTYSTVKKFIVLLLPIQTSSSNQYLKSCLMKTNHLFKHLLPSLKNRAGSRILMALMALFVSIGASAQEAYAVLSTDYTTLTFYYDNQRSSRTNAYLLNTGSNAPGWLGHRETVTSVVVTSAFANARPTSTYR